ncbi:hypothetical protein WDU94_006422 [Cyamophila willieti]
MQDKETEYVRDESDTCTKSDASEYTLYSIPSEKNPLIETTSSDDFIIKTKKIVVETYVSKMSSNGSGEEENESTLSSSEDSELGQADYWYCAQCNKSNNHPKYRYCMKCFRLRRDMFPPKPKATKKRSRSKVNTNNNAVCANEPSLPTCKKRKRHHSSSDNSEEDPDKTIGSNQAKSMKLDTFINKFGNLKANSQMFSNLCMEADELQASKKAKKSNENESSQSLGSQENMSLEASNVNTSSMTTKSLIGKFQTLNSSQYFSNLCKSVDPIYEQALRDNENSVAASSSVEPSPNVSTPARSTSHDVDKMELALKSALCIMCDKAPKNGAFIHLYEVHVCCCYPCGLKVWKQTKKCPSCTLPACKVLKIITS